MQMWEYFGYNSSDIVPFLQAQSETLSLPNIALDLRILNSNEYMWVVNVGGWSATPPCGGCFQQASESHNRTYFVHTPTRAPCVMPHRGALMGAAMNSTLQPLDAVTAQLDSRLVGILAGSGSIDAVGGKRRAGPLSKDNYILCLCMSQS